MRREFTLFRINGRPLILEIYPIKVPKWFEITFWILASLIWLLLSFGCTTTVTPTQVHTSTIAFDGNVQNGGVFGRAPDGSIIVSQSAVDKYNALLTLYGAKLVPAKDQNAGVTTGPVVNGVTIYFMTAQAFVDFGVMNGWQKEGRK